MHIWIRRILVSAATLLAIAYAVTCGWLWLNQDHLIYPGGTVAVDRPPNPETVGLADFRPVTLNTPDGEHVQAWWRPPQNGRGVVLYLHGNGSVVLRQDRSHRLREIADTGLGVLGIDYRGYGVSTGHPSETGLLTDAATAYDFISSQVPGARVAVFGESLGTAVAIGLALQRPVVGIVLDSPMKSVVSEGADEYPMLPIATIMRDHWDSAGRIARIKAPLFIAQCDTDQVTPLSGAKTLFSLAPDPKAMVVLHGCGHIQTWIEPARSTILSDFKTWTAG